MGNRDHLISKSIIDKNGHRRTVRVRPDNMGTSQGRASKVPVAKASGSVVKSAHAKAFEWAIAYLASGDWQTFPYDVQDDLIRRARSGKLSEEELALAKELSDVGADWNLHTFAAEIAAAVALQKYNDTGVIEDAWSVARATGTPAELIQKIYQDNKDNATFAYAVALNESAPQELLFELAGHKEDYVRKAVASNHSSDDATLLKLAYDPHNGVRMDVAENPFASVKVLEVLEAEGGWIGQEARRNIASRGND